jgi:diguanylate cyclase (GGDEF)-like protein
MQNTLAPEIATTRRRTGAEIPAAHAVEALRPLQTPVRPASPAAHMPPLPGATNRDATVSGEPDVAGTTVANADRAETGGESAAAAVANHAKGAIGAAVSHGPVGNAVVFGRLPATAYAGEFAIGDIGPLLNAVKARLCRTVSDVSGSSGVLTTQGGVQSIRSGVLECVAALDQIQATLARELERRDGLEMEISDTQAALAQALAELAGTQAGERYARHLAQHDSLTSLPNRGYFVERLDAELTSLPMRQHAIAVLYLDLDDFKPINDRYGHDTGDELLRIVGVRLSRSVRMDDMVCRLGGDEFGCLLPDVQGRAQLASLATKLIDIIAAPLQVGKRKLTVRPSIGIALGPEHGNTSEDLLKKADLAMYHAKRHQSGFAFFDHATQR